MPVRSTFSSASGPPLTGRRRESTVRHFDEAHAGRYTPRQSAVRGEPLPMGVLDQRFEKNFMITSVDYVFNWARKSAIWPLTFGLACCAIEMIASTTSRFDMAR